MRTMQATLPAPGALYHLGKAGLSRKPNTVPWGETVAKRGNRALILMRITRCTCLGFAQCTSFLRVLSQYVPGGSLSHHCLHKTLATQHAQYNLSRGRCMRSLHSACSMRTPTRCVCAAASMLCPAAGQRQRRCIMAAACGSGSGCLCGSGGCAHVQ